MQVKRGHILRGFPQICRNIKQVRSNKSKLTRFSDGNAKAESDGKNTTSYGPWRLVQLAHVCLQHLWWVRRSYTVQVHDICDPRIPPDPHLLLLLPLILFSLTFSPLSFPFSLPSTLIVSRSNARTRLLCAVSVYRTRGHALDTRRIRVLYAIWRIVDQTVGQLIWIRIGQGGDMAGYGGDTAWTRRADFLGFFLLWA